MAVWNEKKISELTTFRFDPEYYQPQYIDMEIQLLNKNTVRIEDIAYVTDGIHASPEIVESGGVRYLSAKCVKDNDFNLENTIQISIKQNNLNKRTYLRERDILITTVGTIGNAAVVQNNAIPANIDRHLGLIRLNHHSNLDPYYVSTFLNCKFGRFQTLRESTGNVQLNLFIEKIKELRIPLLECWIEVSKKTKDAYSMRLKSKELYSQAEQLLLEELSLSNFKPSHSLFYERPFSETQQAVRFDAEYYHPKHYNLLSKIEKCKYNSSHLGSLIYPIKNGFDCRKFSDKGFPYIRVGDVKNGRIEILNAKKINIEWGEIGKDIKLIPGDVLFTRKGSYGNAAFVRHGQEDAIISSEIMLLRIKNKSVLPEYLTVYLNSIAGFQQVERKVHGVAFYSISQDDLASLKIVIVPNSVQNQICDLVHREDEAINEFRRLLEEAKKMVEDAILGE